jgi:hypothetical protein
LKKISYKFKIKNNQIYLRFDEKNIYLNMILTENEMTKKQVSIWDTPSQLNINKSSPSNFDQCSTNLTNNDLDHTQENKIQTYQR